MKSTCSLCAIILKLVVRNRGMAEGWSRDRINRVHDSTVFSLFQWPPPSPPVGVSMSRRKSTSGQVHVLTYGTEGRHREERERKREIQRGQ